MNAVTKISVSEAKAHLLDLVRRAEAGDEVILTRHGQSIVRLVPVSKKRLNREEFDSLVRDVQAEARATMSIGPCAARSQDFLYDENGLPA